MSGPTAQTMKSGAMTTNINQAITLMTNQGIPVTATHYGFSLQHAELAGGDFAQCGMDNDSSISMSVTVDETPTVKWFFRISYIEMAELIIGAYSAARSLDASRKDIARFLDALDKQYDDGPLHLMTAEFLGDIEGDTEGEIEGE